MKKFKFYLLRTAKSINLNKVFKKTVLIDAENSVLARQMILEMYPDWQVSMFWDMI